MVHSMKLLQFAFIGYALAGQEQRRLAEITELIIYDSLTDTASDGKDTIVQEPEETVPKTEAKDVSSEASDVEDVTGHADENDLQGIQIIINPGSGYLPSYGQRPPPHGHRPGGNPHGGPSHHTHRPTTTSTTTTRRSTQHSRPPHGNSHGRPSHLHGRAPYPGFTAIESGESEQIAGTERVPVIAELSETGAPDATYESSVSVPDATVLEETLALEVSTEAETSESLESSESSIATRLDAEDEEAVKEVLGLAGDPLVTVQGGHTALLQAIKLVENDKTLAQDDHYRPHVIGRSRVVPGTIGGEQYSRRRDSVILPSDATLIVKEVTEKMGLRRPDQKRLEPIEEIIDGALVTDYNGHMITRKVVLDGVNLAEVILTMAVEGAQVGTYGSHQGVIVQFEGKNYNAIPGAYVVPPEPFNEEGLGAPEPPATEAPVEEKSQIEEEANAGQAVNHSWWDKLLIALGLKR